MNDDCLKLTTYFGERDQADSELLRQLGGRLRGRDAGHLEPRVHPGGEDADERRRRAAGAEPEDLPVLDQPERVLGEPRRAVVVCAHRPSATPARASASRAACTTRSGVKPNFVWSAFRGADAPNVRIPMISPAGPT